MGHLLRIEKWAENLEEITLNQWLKAEGGYLEVGDSLCEIITDKATFEYEIEFAGTLLKTYAAEKSVVPVGYVIAFVGEPGESPPAGVEEENQRLLAAQRAAASPEVDLDIRVSMPVREGKRVRATPAARRVAREQGVRLEDVAEWLEEDRAVNDKDITEYVSHLEED